MAVRIRHAGRYREIAMALMRHGFGYMVEEMGLFHVLSLPVRWISREEPETVTLGERVRKVLEDLGPAFVKLGQLASTRSDLLPDPLIQELVKLQERVPPFSSESARQLIEQEWGVPIDEVLSSFEDKPLAAASIGQVHAGRLKTGEMVAIKVQRPGVARMIGRDLEILRDLISLAEKRWDWVKQYRVDQIVDEFARAMMAELDYSHEARNAEKVAAYLTDHEYIHIPSIYWEFTSSKVLTMEYADGITLSRYRELADKGHHLKTVAERLIEGMLQQIFIHGFFHADPHPGNLLVRADGKLVFLDFGLVGQLSEEMKDHLSGLIIALMRRNTDSMVRAISRMGLIPDDCDMDRLRADMDRLRGEYVDVPFSKVRIGKALSDLFAVAQRHQIMLPPDLTLLGKSLLTLEGVIEMLDPELSIIDMAEPFGRKLLKERYNSRRIGRKVLDGVSELAQSLLDLPGQARQLSAMISKGKLRVEISVPELQSLMHKLDRISNRLSFSIVLLAFSIIMVGLIIGSSLSHEPIMLWHFPVIELGFIVAILMVAWLLYSIFKSGRF
ncbi:MULTISPECIES: ABC1 kinase family protein [Paenibacillus]|uniref:ABC transporter n=1 Tax=Paenibacillus campinasensis TaxID=66347 RepID=A0A268EVY0_9BACL|nr:MULTISPECIES: AarF/ABC1/UbiB kinase family protein [Paenibacillus]MUG67570.1 ABC transporter [Paenibacillus campinasensis]PAD77282.1 ABC transporter [Paenibacillus campinasensis]PAK52074.1 ABC transporter [Paenibacillus sp. 7541]